MRRTWPFVILVAVVGGAAGVAVAGRPTPADPYVIRPSDLPTSVPTTLAAPVTTRAAAGTASSTTSGG